MNIWLAWLVFGLIEHLWLRVEFGGDVALGRRIAAAVEHAGPRAYFASLRTHLENVDLVVANLEGSVRLPARRAAGRRFDLSFEEAALSCLVPSGIRHFGLSNNHASDGGPRSRARTIAALAHRGLHGFHGVCRVTRKGIPLSIIACDLTATHGGRAIGIIRQEAVDRLTFVFPHLGAEDTDRIDIADRAFLRACLDAGAAGVFGHHPHRIKAGGSLGGKPAYASLGSLLFDRSRRPDCFGLLVRVHIWAGIPVAWERFIVHLRPGNHQPLVWPGGAGFHLYR
ncbi:MAG TPA: CapA family protein [Candidatus Ozemobacteraceae bacterium]|nr:CapA family protein [Candidatus Ozemobacteraceae bacterium]